MYLFSFLWQWLVFPLLINTIGVMVSFLVGTLSQRHRQKRSYNIFPAAFPNEKVKQRKEIPQTFGLVFSGNLTNHALGDFGFFGSKTTNSLNRYIII